MGFQDLTWVDSIAKQMLLCDVLLFHLNAIFKSLDIFILRLSCKTVEHIKLNYIVKYLASISLSFSDFIFDGALPGSAVLRVPEDHYWR